MKLVTERMTKRIAPLIALLTLFAWSCDLFEKDVVPDENDVTLGQSDFYTVPNASTLIDLKSMVKSYSEVSLVITNQPSHGDLSRIKDAVFSYKPKKDFRGKDFFMVDIRSKGVSVLIDSVIISVDQDTTSFPCGLIAVHDSVTIPFSHFPGPKIAHIDVLENDRICGLDKDDVKISIFSAPSNGRASVDEVFRKEVVYVANGGFTGHDSFIYKISSVSDTSVYSLGLVSVFVDDGTCHMTLGDDFEVIVKRPFENYYINVFGNDIICAIDSVNDQFTIISPAKFGTSDVQALGLIRYVPNAESTSNIDSVTYKFCQAGVCNTARLRMSIVGDSCKITAYDDFVDLPLNGGSTEVFALVYFNDSICNQIKDITIIQNPHTGSAAVHGNSIKYTANSQTSPSDSLKYRVCDLNNSCSDAKVVIRRE